MMWANRGTGMGWKLVRTRCCLCTGSLTLPVPGRLAGATSGAGDWRPRWVARWFPVAQTVSLACRGSLAQGASLRPPLRPCHFGRCSPGTRHPGRLCGLTGRFQCPRGRPCGTQRSRGRPGGPAAPTGGGQHSLKLSRTFAVNQVGEDRGWVW